MAREFLPAAGFLRQEMDVNWLFTADVLLPVQDHHSPVDHWLRRLSQAILADALKRLGGRARDGHEAWEWVRSDAESCFSFLTVCAVLQLDAQAVRSELSQHFAPGCARQGSSSRLPRHQAAGQHVRREHSNGLASTSPPEAKPREVH